jgi:hypothetical protein
MIQEKKYFKNRLFHHAVEHGKSTDHIHWDDLMFVGTGTYDDVKISKTINERKWK